MKAITKEYIRRVIAQLRETTEVLRFAITERQDTGEIVGLCIECTGHSDCTGLRVFSPWDETFACWNGVDFGNGKVYPNGTFVSRYVGEDYFSKDGETMSTETTNCQQERSDKPVTNEVFFRDLAIERLEKIDLLEAKVRELGKKVAEVERCFSDPWRDGWLSDLSELRERAIIVRDRWEGSEGPATFVEEEAIDDLCKTVADLEGESAEETVDDRVALAGLRRDGR